MAPLYRGNWLVKLAWLTQAWKFILVPGFVICARELTSSPIPMSTQVGT